MEYSKSASERFSLRRGGLVLATPRQSGPPLRLFSSQSITYRKAHSRDNPLHFSQRRNLLSSTKRSTKNHYFLNKNNRKAVALAKGGRHVTVLIGTKQFKFYCVADFLSELVKELKLKLHKTITVGASTLFHSNIVGFITEHFNHSLDYLLSEGDGEIPITKNQPLILRPIYAERQDVIGLHSFQILRCVGSGGFSNVYLCRFKENGKYYAMKMIDKQFIVRQGKKKIVMNQLNVMIQLRKVSHISQLLFAFQAKTHLVFVLQYYPGGELFGLVKRFKKMPQAIARFYFIQILLGLAEIHQRGIAYRDFKPQNILLDREGHIYIADFGLAKPNVKDKRAFSFCGSPQYMPPQMIKKKGHSLPVDFYCLGALFFQLVTGLPPFYNKDTQLIYDGTLNLPITFPKHADLSGQIKDLLLKLLDKNEETRLGTKHGTKEILQHQFFKGVDLNSYRGKKITPPVNFSSVEDLHFNSQEMSGEQTQLMKTIFAAQAVSTQAFVKVMNHFYFDHRTIEQSTPASISHFSSAINSHSIFKVSKQSVLRNTLKNKKDFCQKIQLTSKIYPYKHQPTDTTISKDMTKNKIFKRETSPFLLLDNFL